MVVVVVVVVVVEVLGFAMKGKSSMGSTSDSSDDMLKNRKNARKRGEGGDEVCAIYVRRMMCCNQERSVSYIPSVQKERRGELMVCFGFVFSLLGYGLL